MRIANVSTLGVSGIADGKRDFTRGGAPASLVILTGPPASGKTTLLEAIATTKEAIAPYGGAPDRRMVGPGKTAAKVTIDWVLDEEELAVAGGTANRPSEALFGDVKPAHETDWDDGLRLILGRWEAHLPKVEYFHAQRSLTSPLGGGSGRISARARLACDNSKYDGLIDTITAWTSGGDDRALRFEAGFAALCGTRTFAGITNRGGVRTAGFEARGAAEWATVKELSAAEHQAAVFAATFAVIGLWHSVVLIDNPELFLPTDMIGPFVRALASMGDNQLVLATSSREVLTSSDALVIDLGKG